MSTPGEPVGTASSPSSPASAAPVRSKGATFAVRVASAAVLIAAVAATLATFHWGFVLLVAALVGIATWELTQAAHRLGVSPAWPVLVVGVPATLVATYAAGTIPALTNQLNGLGPVHVGLLVLSVTLLVALGLRLRGGVDGYLADISASALILAYGGLLVLSVVWLMLSPRPVAFLVAYVACIAANDSGAYWFGSLFGRHTMAPGISPAKTWEGFVGGVLLGVVAGVLLGLFLLDVAWWWGLVFGAVLAVCATVGDLVESAIKRDVGVKDMGRLMPGHGGAMDRLDSMLFCAPVAVVLYALMGLLTDAGAA